MHTFTLSLIKKTVLLFSVLFPLILIGIIGGGVCVYAAGNQFTVGANVTNDSTPPSTPAGVNAVPVSSSQINLDWAASTDNVSVGGYVVRRNGTILGTTTGISYSDPGLSPSTGYSYTVQAFDTSVNYSGESTVAYATTSASGGGGGGGDTTPPTVSSFSPANGATGVSTTSPLVINMSELVNKLSGSIVIKKTDDNSVVETISVASGQVVVIGSQVTITLSAPLFSNTGYYVEVTPGAFADQSSNAFAGFSGSATWGFSTADSIAPTISGVTSSTTYTTAGVSFSTDELALATFSWGTTTDYANGSGSEVSYFTTHYFGLSGLATGTTYYFRIVAHDAQNNQSVFTGSFTTDTPPPPPDTTPPANVSNLTASPSYTSIALSWTNPNDSDFEVVRVMRKHSGYPVDQNDGIQVYLGSGSSVVDSALSTSTTYYYAVFSRDLSGNYSSGSIISATTLDNTPPPPTPTPTPTPTPGGSSDTGTTTATTTTPIVPVATTTPTIATSTSPFVSFPATGTPAQAIVDLPISQFIFTQPGEKQQSVKAPGGTIRVDGDKQMTVSIDARLLPEVLKTITITIQDPDTLKTTSYLLRINKDLTRYETTIAPLKREGEIAFDISILDHENQGLRRFPGVLDVFRKKTESIIPQNVQDAVMETIESIRQPVASVAPVAVPVGVAVGVSQAALVATNVTSFYDLYLLFLKLLGLITGVFRKKRKVPWGVVYDSVTKRPLDPAYVLAQLRQSKESKGEAITDLDGRYGFLLNPGEYTIVANKTHYRFPSEKLKGKAKDEFYENLYFGDSFHVREGSVVQYNIPLDPLEFDWNEYAKNQDKVFKVYSRNTMVKQVVFTTIFVAGLVLSSVTLALSPSVLNAVVVAIYVSIILFQIFWRATHKITRVIDKKTGKPIAYALVKVWLAGVNTIVKKSVSDETGRFYFLVPPGKYYITVEQKMPDGNYQKVLETEEQQLKGGVLTSDILVG